MASNLGPDLTAGRLAVERLMDDTCTVTRTDDEGQDEDLDPETLLPIRDAPETIYDGPCIIGRDATNDVATLTIPVHAPALANGDTVLVTSSRRDPYLSGTKYHVTTVIFKTMAVSRKAQLELIP